MAKKRGGGKAGSGGAPPWGLLLAGTVGLAAAVLLGLGLHGAEHYAKMIANNTFDVDAYVARGIPGFPAGGPPTTWDRAKVVAAHSLSTLGHERRTAPIPLSVAPSPHVPGLLVSCGAAQEGEGGRPVEALADETPPPLVIATIRMGFGHHRIAHATASWGVRGGGSTIFHDLLNIVSPEASLISRTDDLWTKGSRLASEVGGLAERFFGSLTANGGDANCLRTAYQLAEVASPLLSGLPRDVPIIATHPLVGLVAVAAGFTKVINTVVDNHPQWYLIVPGALNLVQGPKNYLAFLRMGVPESDVRIAGHWIGEDLASNVRRDCTARAARARGGAPLRVLVPVGGAGAQRTFVAAFLRALAPEIASGDVQVLVNAGDHAHMKDAFVQALSAMGMDGAYQVIDSIEGVKRFQASLLRGEEPPTPVTLFAFNDYYPAVATTDMLVRVSDLLACKPSELAFYPVPKLMLRRVGDHEAGSAIRTNELGDGTVEVREPEEARAWVKLFRTRPSILLEMNDRIVKNADSGIYDGCKNAVAWARNMSDVWGGV